MSMFSLAPYIIRRQPLSVSLHTHYIWEARFRARVKLMRNSPSSRILCEEANIFFYHLTLPTFLLRKRGMTVSRKNETQLRCPNMLRNGHGGTRNEFLGNGDLHHPHRHTCETRPFCETSLVLLKTVKILSDCEARICFGLWI